MRRLALLLAASVLGTGCIQTSDTCATRTVSVGWPSFLLANGAQTPSCSVAGVSLVAVYLNDQQVVNSQRADGFFDCAAQAGVSVVGVPSGTQRFTVEGLDAAKTILLRDEVTVSGNACGEQIVDTRPAEGTVTVDYAFASAGGNVCTAGGSYIWFSMFDNIANVTAAVADETANTRTYVCGTTPISFPLPVGAFTLQRIEEVVPSGGAYVATATNCAPTSFSVNAAAPSVVQVDLADTNVFCPAAAAPASPGRTTSKLLASGALTAKP